MTRWRDQGGRDSTEGIRPSRELRNRGDQHTITEKKTITLLEVVSEINPPLH
jgi:hypothetical protein